MCCSHDPYEALARRVLYTLLPAGAIVTAVYQPPGEPPAWAAERVGRRLAWTPDPMAERGPDPEEWPMVPYPLSLSAAVGEPARSVPLKHLREIEPIGPRRKPGSE